MKMVNIVLVGLGKVGKAFFRVAWEKRELCLQKYGLDIQFKAIVEKFGVLSSPNHLTNEEVLAKNPDWKSGIRLDSLLERESPGVMVECTPSNVENGEPGLSHLHQALDRGWHVVTANKGPLVVDFPGLKQKARKKHLALKFSGATAAALPTLDVALFSLAGTEIKAIEGILNGTTNYILTRMEDGMDYKEALREAQAKGIAEPDPSLDVEGWDTASKILLISNEVLGTEFSLKDVKVEGITNISPAEINKARKKDKSLKLLGKLAKVKDEIRIEVTLSAIDDFHPLFGVDGANKGITFTTDTMDKITVTGGKSDPRGAGASLLKDTINIYRSSFF
jgi:homoserine dehydrogenase